MTPLEAVFQKAKTDTSFAKDLLIDPGTTCTQAGISLNAGEKKILDDAIEEVRKYYAEKLYLASLPPAIRGNTICIISC